MTNWLPEESYTRPRITYEFGETVSKFYFVSHKIAAYVRFRQTESTNLARWLGKTPISATWPATSVSLDGNRE